MTKQLTYEFAPTNAKGDPSSSKSAPRVVTKPFGAALFTFALSALAKRESRQIAPDIKSFIGVHKSRPLGAWFI